MSVECVCISPFSALSYTVHLCNGAMLMASLINTVCYKERESFPCYSRSPLQLWWTMYLVCASSLCYKLLSSPRHCLIVRFFLVDDFVWFLFRACQHHSLIAQRKCRRDGRFKAAILAGLGPRRAVFYSWCCHWPAGWLWISPLASSCLSFSIHKMGMIVTSLWNLLKESAM